MLKKIGLLFVVLSLAACGGAEDRKAVHLERGNTYFEEGNFEKARVEFKNVLQIDPDDVAARFALGRVQAQLKNWRQAVGHFQHVVQLDPDHVDARIRLGQIFLLARTTDRAMEAVEEALKRAPDNADGLALRGTIRAQAGNTEGALSDGRAALKASPGHVNATGLIAATYIRSGDLEAAAAVLEDGIQHNPDNAALRIVLAGVVARTGDSEGALQLLREVTQLEPDAFGHRVRLAAFLGKLDRLDEAEEVLRKAVADNPGNATAKLGLVDFLNQRRSPEQAEQELLSLIEENPDEHALRIGLARLYASQGALEKVKAVYRDIITRDGTGPNGLTARTALAKVFVTENEIPEAERLLTEVLEENALVLRGDISLARKDAPAAISDYRAALRDHPNAAGVLRRLAQAQFLTGEEALAQDNLEKAVEIDPKDVVAQLMLAQLLLKNVGPERAVAQLEELLTAVPNYMGGLDALYKLRVSQKDWAGALATADRMKAGHPDRPEGYHWAGLIKQAQNELEPSIGEFAQALEKSPGAAEPLAKMVQSYVALKRPQEAEAVVSDVLQEQPDNAQAHHLLGGLLLVREDFEGAKAEFLKAIELSPAFAKAYHNLAIVHVVQTDLEAALGVLKEGITATQHRVPLLVVEAAGLYERLERYDEAVALYDAFMEQNPGSALAANNLAMLLITRNGEGDLARATELVAAIRDSDNPAFLDTVAWLHHKKGEDELAIPILKRLVEQMPDEPHFLYHLGMSYQATGDKEAAREQLEKALATGKAFRGIEDARAALEAISGT